MNINKALKVKNRLAGEVKRLEGVFHRENSRRNDNISKIDPKAVFGELLELRDNLINLKGAINEASAPISKTLAKLAEAKLFKNFIESVPTREGEEVTLIGSNREKLTYNWVAYLNKERVDDLAKISQETINGLQDEVDEFNAKTKVEFAE